MARIIYGSIITDIAGSIGGITYQKNGSGTIARLKPRKTKTNTQKQRDQQPRLKQVQKEWNELSLTNKVLWNDFASVNNKIGLDGKEKVLTGYQWFLTINQNLLLINENIKQVPPVYSIINPVNSLITIYSNFEVRLKWDVPVDCFIFPCLVYSSFIINSISKFDFNKVRFLEKATSITTDALRITNSENNESWNVYFKSIFPPELGEKSFYLVSMVRFIEKSSGISSLAYTTIARFIWTGADYEVE